MLNFDPLGYLSYGVECKRYLELTRAFSIQLSAMEML